MTWRDIIVLRLSDGYTVRLAIGPIVPAILTVVWFAVLAVRGTKLWPWRRWDVVEGDIRLGGIGSVKVRPNREDAQVAHSAWVELATRKAGLPFDPDHDVIVEIYASWYELFKEVRWLAKTYPAHKVRDDDEACKTIDTMVEALNKGLRPHLTRWQARFRRWYDQALKDHPEKSPQEIQRLFQGYQDLVSDLQRVNAGLLDYMTWLRRVATGR